MPIWLMKKIIVSHLKYILRSGCVNFWCPTTVVQWRLAVDVTRSLSISGIETLGPSSPHFGTLIPFTYCRENRHLDKYGINALMNASTIVYGKIFIDHIVQLQRCFKRNIIDPVRRCHSLSDRLMCSLSFLASSGFPRETVPNSKYTLCAHIRLALRSRKENTCFNVYTFYIKLYYVLFINVYIQINQIIEINIYENKTCAQYAIEKLKISL